LGEKRSTPRGRGRSAIGFSFGFAYDAEILFFGGDDADDVAFDGGFAVELAREVVDGKPSCGLLPPPRAAEKPACGV
jgi:hypothetical protein